MMDTPLKGALYAMLTAPVLVATVVVAVSVVVPLPLTVELLVLEELEELEEPAPEFEEATVLVAFELEATLLEAFVLGAWLAVAVVSAEVAFVCEFGAAMVLAVVALL